MNRILPVGRVSLLQAQVARVGDIGAKCPSDSITQRSSPQRASGPVVDDLPPLAGVAPRGRSIDWQWLDPADPHLVTSELSDGAAPETVADVLFWEAPVTDAVRNERLPMQLIHSKWNMGF
ncbi:hypothetical protein ASPBRDRAFT_332568 [Aspergillus brasiliensis CBS 101740]|uniref:Uncharacterized protein n=1 Tax=Aspergillus brasiliensis (strain CBS 101740 / IMI 381727 / IBT 21946) TaxID=767769 RepID=A0A1L9U7B6_ASPBC|nr:hypothetical protein ASPBRDRAFT_332568 [Aspergillus brasiliensis CBS 101740]